MKLVRNEGRSGVVKSGRHTQRALRPSRHPSHQRGRSTRWLTGAQQSHLPLGPEGQGGGHDAWAVSVISVVQAQASPLALLAFFSLFPISSEGWYPTDQGSASPGTWNPDRALSLPSPRYLPEGEMSCLYNTQIPEGAGPSLSCIVFFSEMASPELSHAPGRLFLLTLFTEGR